MFCDLVGSTVRTGPVDEPPASQTLTPAVTKQASLGLLKPFSLVVCHLTWGQERQFRPLIWFTVAGHSKSLGCRSGLARTQQTHENRKPVPGLLENAPYPSLPPCGKS